MGKQPPLPLPPTHPPETVLKRSGYEEEKVGGVNGRNLWPTRGHRAVFDPQEATDEQPNTEALNQTLEEELRDRMLTQEPQEVGWTFTPCVLTENPAKN